MGGGVEPKMHVDCLPDCQTACAAQACLLVKLDRANKRLADGGGGAISHLLALGFGEIEPSLPAKAAKPAKSKAAGDNEPVRLLHQSKALGRKS